MAATEEPSDAGPGPAPALDTGSILAGPSLPTVTVRLDDARCVGICLHDGPPPRIQEFGALQEDYWIDHGLRVGDRRQPA